MDVFAALRVVQIALFAGLGVVAFSQWRRQRGEAAAWLAATFGSLGVVSLVSEALPEDGAAGSGAEVWAGRALVALVVAFPYLLYRFMTSFGEPRRWVSRSAAGLTAAAVAGAFLLPPLPEGAPGPGWLHLYVYLVVVQWVALSGLVAVRLWRGGEGLPTVSRRRMRTLGLGAAGLALAVVLAGLAPSSSDESPSEVATQLLGIASGLLFLVGFIPPSPLRRAWRRPEEAAFQRAEAGLMEAEDARAVADALLPHVSQLFGGCGAVLLDDRGGLIGCHGLDEPAARALVDRLRSGDPPREGIGMPLRSGWLAVQASAYTPFFGRDETDMLRRLAVMAELALARAELWRQERRSRAQLVEAQRLARVGSWEYDIASGDLGWSEELYRIFGLPPGGRPNSEEAIARIHPDDRPRVEAAMEAALSEGRPYESDHRLVHPDGTVVHVQTRGRVVEDDSGAPAKMIGTAQDVTEAKRQEAFRQQFIANAAHELRTPLTSLLGLTELLASGRRNMPEERIEAAYAAIGRAGARLTVLVHNLLDLSRLQQSSLELSPEPVPVAPLAEDVLESAPPPPEVTVGLAIPDGVVVHADRVRLHQVLANLLTNAFRYGGSRIEVGARASEGDVVISVDDDGPGVEEGLVPQLFEPFARGSSATGVGGSGLGLAIVKMLVDLSRGRVWYERAPSGGARFCLRLPQAQ
jgi:PAS domain S-box-containing protein